MIGTKKLRHQINRNTDLINYLQDETKILSMKMNLKLDDLIKITNIHSECNKTKIKEFEDETKIDFERLEMQVEKKIILANRSIKWVK